MLTSQRIDRVNSNPTIVLEVNGIKELKEVLIPLISKIVNKMGEQFKIIEYPVWQSGKLPTLRGKLPNSGDLLKLLVPNLVESYRGG
ncbi:cytochrome c oxidase subunit III (mitochondrion) protein [Rutstroemia sp. NJR-2017a WRK4]|nr:cytochrome c oxidase subunit III (mitochondrion) protein [Rutstroemia sp. NJR-2017a WRK4]